VSDEPDMTSLVHTPVVEAAAEPEAEPVVEPVAEPVKRPRKPRTATPATRTVHNPSRVMVVLNDAFGQGIYLGPLESQTLSEERISDSIEAQARLGLIILS
jgi:hypothetical protein